MKYDVQDQHRVVNISFFSSVFIEWEVERAPSCWNSLPPRHPHRASSFVLYLDFVDGSVFDKEAAALKALRVTGRCVFDTFKSHG